jgi:hypothetical protein
MPTIDKIIGTKFPIRTIFIRDPTQASRAFSLLRTAKIRVAWLFSTKARAASGVSVYTQQ